ncbi:ATPase, partial [Enterococcus hirae]
SKLKIAMLTSTQLDTRDLLFMVSAALGLKQEEVGKSALLLALEQHLKRQSRSGQRHILIVDEAQGLSSGALEELRLLA